MRFSLRTLIVVMLLAGPVCALVYQCVEISREYKRLRARPVIIELAD
jgi:hypothetical protein